MKYDQFYSVVDICLVLYYFMIIAVDTINSSAIKSSNDSLSNQYVLQSKRNQCPLYSRLLCPTSCDPTCKKPLSKRSSCSQPITCAEKVCVCNPDFVRDDDGDCIPAERCSEKCPESEIYKLCPTACEIHCGNFNSVPRKCPEDEREDHECIAECVCPTGSIRDYFTRKCVKKDYCSIVAGLTSCPPNQEYLQCGPLCEKICNQETDCKSKGCKSGCFCKKGFIRQNENGKCVPDDNSLVIVRDSGKNSQQWSETNTTNKEKILN